MDKRMLENYADFAVRSGVCVQPGQVLIIDCPAEGAFFARLCAEAAFRAGARDVVAHYGDEQLGRIRLQHAGNEALADVRPWRLRRYLDYAESEGGACVLAISSRNPEVNKGLDAARIDLATTALDRALRPWRELTRSGKVQWCIAAIPNEAWAAKVFPGIPPEQAVERLWSTIFTVCRVSGGNPVAEWAAHVAAMQVYRDRLNALQLDALHLKSANGTDLVLGLPEQYLFSGAEEYSEAGVEFLPNIPTEEVFTAPHRLRANGFVKSSMPFNYNGALIEGIAVRFENGLATEYGAEKGGELLHRMLGTDEGARRLGEIALVPVQSPIRQTGLLFYNTLFDENAACHMAFGAGYPSTVKGGTTMTAEQLLAAGVNDSLIHEDIMIGTADMSIDGITRAGGRVPLFREGGWVL